MLVEIGLTGSDPEIRCGDPNRIPRRTPTDVTDGLTERVVTSQEISFVSIAREPAGIHSSFAAHPRPGRSAPGRINPKGALCG